MTKKLAILIVVAVEALVYLFLLVGLPALKEAVGARDVFTWPLIVYLLPGIIGFAMLVLIWRKKEVKEK